MKLFKTMLLLMVVVLLAACNQANSGDTPSAEEEKPSVEMVGEPITINEVTPVDEVVANPNEYLEQPVLVEGLVMGRCMGSGCWIALKTNTEKGRLIVTTVDDSFIFPEECMDKEVQVQGMLMLKTPEEIEAGAEHSAGSDHECPNPEYYFKPTGMKIKA